METTRAHVWVSGRVQGVCFRAETCDMASEHDLAGWVKNLHDGRVEAVFEGPKERVDQAVAWCRHGPPAARVAHVEVTWEAATGEFHGFSTRW